MPSKYRTVQVTEGEWYAIGGFDRDICCDCCLTHDTEFKLEGGKIMFRTKVNRRETAKLRAAHGIKVTKER